MQDDENVSGRLFGVMPYDFRLPSLAKFKARLWNPGGPMLVPKVWGVGWTLNFANRGSWALLAGIIAATATLAFIS